MSRGRFWTCLALCGCLVAAVALERRAAALVVEIGALRMALHGVEAELAAARTDANTLTASIQSLTVEVNANLPSRERYEAAMRSAKKAAEPEEFAP